MLTTKAVILIIIGLVGGQPKSVQVGVFPSSEDCQKAGLALVAAAASRQVLVSGVCVVTPFTVKVGTQS
jgi:hypothetical protein